MKEMKTLKLPGQDEPYEVVDAKARERAVQGDWNVNDENDPAYVKNRPFYETDPVEATFIEEQSVTIGDDMYAELNGDVYFTEGQTYTVNFNGTSYECVAWANKYEGISIGNGDIYGGEGMGGDEPFSIESYANGSLYLNVTTAGTYTISAVGMVTEVIKIPDKYLPKVLRANLTLGGWNSDLIGYNSSVTDLIIPETFIHDNVLYTVTAIGDEYNGNVFREHTNLTSVVIPNSVKTISYGAFYDCVNLTKVILPYGLTEIDEGVFYGCTNLTDIVIPRGVTSIDVAAFAHCTSLTSITLPDSMTYIADSVFYGCTNLKSIVIPRSITYIGYNTFKDCSSLTTVYYTGTKEDWDNANNSVKNNDSLSRANIVFSYSGDKQDIITGTEGQIAGFDSNGDLVAMDNNAMTLKNLIATLPSSVDWRSITYGNGRFVAVTYRTTTAAYSDDGITWTRTTLPGSPRWLSVAHGNGRFVAVASNSSTAAYSDDGITWYETTLPSSSGWHSVTYGNGKFVAVASGTTTAAYSDDGINWYETTLPSSTSWWLVTCGNDRFVAVASYTTAAYSDDGIEWIEATLPSSASWSSITYGDGRFVIIASADSNKAAYSDDGITWYEATLPSSANWCSITYGSDMFVAIANPNKVAYSTDGISWTETTLPSSTTWNSIAYGNDMFVAIANNSTAVAYSYDGITWIDQEYRIYQNNENIIEAVKTVVNVQPDWNQNDETAPDYVKNRTHWSVCSKTYTIPEQTFNCNSGNFVDVTANNQLVEGTEYTVAINETKYKLKAERYFDSNDGYYVTTLGNPNLYNHRLPDNGLGLNFAFGIFESGDNPPTSFVANLNGECTIAVYEENEEIYHLDPKYIKDMYYDNGIVETTLVDSVDIDFCYDNGNGIYFHEDNVTFELDIVDGETYIVEWDNVEYECVAQKMSFTPAANNSGMFGIGNAARVNMGDFGNNEPFCIASFDGYIQIAAFDLGGIHTMSIKVEKEDIVTINPKYIKDMYGEGDLVKTLIVDRTTLDIEDFPTINPFNITINVGDIYNVTWNDVTYECVAYIAEGPNLPCIGNGSAIGLNGGNGEPFFIAVDDGDVLVFAEELGTCTVSIEGMLKKIIKVPDKYLKNSNIINGEGIGSLKMSVQPTGSEVYSSTYYNTPPSGPYSFSEGIFSVAFGEASHAEGMYARAIGSASHAEGIETYASGSCSHAEGRETSANGYISHAEGYCTVASSEYQHVQGYYNKNDESNTYAHIVGNGDWGIRSNAHTLDWKGNAWFAGDVYVGSASGTDRDDGSVKLATMDDLNNAKDAILLKDKENGCSYYIEMRSGKLTFRCKAVSLEVTTMPTITTYVDGSVFDPSGMVITATAQDGSRYEVTDYTYDEDIMIEKGHTTVYLDEVYVNIPLTITEFNPETTLIDFEYTDNGDGTYTLTAWKETLNGEPSTELIVPNNSNIIV